MKRAVYVLLTIILVAVTMFSALADNDEYIAVSDDEMKIKNETREKLNYFSLFFDKMQINLTN